MVKFDEGREEGSGIDAKRLDDRTNGVAVRCHKSKLRHTDDSTDERTRGNKGRIRSDGYSHASGFTRSRYLVHPGRGDLWNAPLDGCGHHNVARIRKRHRGDMRGKRIAFQTHQSDTHHDQGIPYSGTKAILFGSGKNEDMDRTGRHSSHACNPLA